MTKPRTTIEEALEVLQLPPFISREDIKKQYRFLARKHHPDKGGEAEQMEKINQAYTQLITYIEKFRYSFDDAELSKQFAGVDYEYQFKP